MSTCRDGVLVRQDCLVLHILRAIRDAQEEEYLRNLHLETLVYPLNIEVDLLYGIRLGLHQRLLLRVDVVVRSVADGVCRFLRHTADL